MAHFFDWVRHFFSELRRRNVYQVAVAYLAAGFVVVELANIAAGAFDLPGWFQPMVWTACGLGFPIALVLAWALEMTPEGVRVEGAEETEGTSEGAPAPTSSPRELWVGASVLALLLVGVWWGWGGLGGGDGADPAESRRSEIEERSIAVLPFEVSGAGAEEWRDGMVTVLSMNLDGAAGLRAISERTVLAAWEKRDSTGVETAVDQAVAVARDVGAEYAIVGSAVQLGEKLRLGAEVRRVDSRNVVGEVEVEGAPGSVIRLTDRLTRKVLGVLLEKSDEAIPSVDMASITTSSLDALKAFLRGERHVRSAQYEAALEDYNASVSADSAFALAYARLALCHGWLRHFAKSDRYWRLAEKYSGQLPRRERRLARAVNLGNSVAQADSLRRLAVVYPDDPNVWYQLGEVLYHGAVPGGLPAADVAFGRAIELDPGMAPYHHHFVELAFSVRHDSALAADRLRRHPSSGPYKSSLQNSLKLAFGTADQSQAATNNDDLEVRGAGLQHPTDGDLWIQALRDWTPLDQGYSLLWRLAGVNHIYGRIETAYQLALDEWSPTAMTCLLGHASTLSMPVPDSLAQKYLTPKTLPSDAETDQLLCAGLYLIDQGREQQFASVLRRLQSKEGRLAPVVKELRGYRAFQSGDLRQAEQLWSGQNESGRPGAVWRGDLYRKLGRLQKAESWYLGAWRMPIAHERLGQLYEEMGKPEKAAAAYERFILAWKNADPALQARVEAARNRLQALPTDADTNSLPASAQ